MSTLRAPDPRYASPEPQPDGAREAAGGRAGFLSRGPGPRLTWLLIGLLCAVWGTTWLVIQEGLEDLPPLTALGLRFAVAGVVLAAVAPGLRRVEGGGRPTWRLTLVMGLCLDALPYAVIYWAEQTIPSGLTCVLWGVYPLALAVAGHFLLPGERLRPVAALGLLAGFAGLAVLFAADLRALSAEAVAVGGALLLSPAVSVVGTIAIKRGGAHTSSALLCRNGLLVAAAVVLPVALAVERGASIAWTGQAAFSVGYLALAGTVLAFTIYFWLLRHVAASKLALIAYMTPVVALSVGWLTRGEPIGASTIAGTALIAAGVMLAGRGRR